MKKDNIFISVGYILAFISFSISLLFRVSGNSNTNNEVAAAFMVIGAVLLLVTSISKIISARK